MLRNYIKLALKVLARRKFFTFISLFGISLTLVVLMVGTAILDNLFSPRAPESRMNRALGIFIISQVGPQGSQTSPAGYGFLDQYVRTLPSAEKVTIFSQPHEVVVYQDSRTIETLFRRTDGAYWQVLDHTFLEGGPFTQADDDAGRLVAVITRDLRSSLFGDGAGLGRTVEVDGQRFRVIGVVENVPVTRYSAFSGVWAPIGTMKTNEYKRGVAGAFNAVALARSTADFPKLRAEFAEKVKGVTLDDPKEFNTLRAGLDTTFEAFARMLTGNGFDAGAPAIVRVTLIVMALLFVTLPVMNLVSINLSRILERASEIGVRKAFGASSRTLVGQFIVENVVLTVIGGAIGFVLTLAAIAAMNRIEWIPFLHFDVNLRIFFYGMLIAAAFGVLSGVYPAWRMSRMQAVNALRGGA